MIMIGGFGSFGGFPVQLIVALAGQGAKGKEPDHYRQSGRCGF
jgi:hypothetical protein